MWQTWSNLRGAHGEYTETVMGSRQEIMPECKVDVFRRCCPYNLKWAHRAVPVILDWA